MWPKVRVHKLGIKDHNEDFLHHLAENTNLQKRILHPSAHLRFIQVTNIILTSLPAVDICRRLGAIIFSLLPTEDVLRETSS